MNPARSVRPVVAFLIGLAVALGPVAASAQLKPWDQETVTKLARELADAVKAIRSGMRQDPNLGNVATMQSRAQQRYMDTLRQLERSTNQLATRLQAGAGFDDTIGTAQRIRALIRDAEQDGRRIMTTAHMMELYLPAEKVIDQLGPFYFEPPREEPLDKG